METKVKKESIFVLLEQVDPMLVVNAILAGNLRVGNDSTETVSILHPQPFINEPHKYLDLITMPETFISIDNKIDTYIRALYSNSNATKGFILGLLLGDIIVKKDGTIWIDTEIGYKLITDEYSNELEFAYSCTEMWSEFIYKAFQDWVPEYGLLLLRSVEIVTK